MAKPLLLTGRRVVLRTTTASDWPALITIRSTDEVRCRWRANEDIQNEFAEDLLDDETVQLTIETDDQVIGLIQFSEADDPEYWSASIDIYIDPALHRRGYGAESIMTLVDYLIDQRGHHRITIDPAAGNIGAIACYSSVGFKPVGILRAYERQDDGTWADGLLMDLLPGDRTWPVA